MDSYISYFDFGFFYPFSLNSIVNHYETEWADDLEGVKIIEGGEPLESEFLYWVGCAGSFDDKNKKVSRAMAQLLSLANVSFSILGPSEMCTGDPARRSGNEYIFQMLAAQNIETLNSMGVKKIITKQNGQAVAILSAPVARSSCDLSTFMFLPVFSSIHTVPPLL